MTCALAVVSEGRARARLCGQTLLGQACPGALPLVGSWCRAISLATFALAFHSRALERRGPLAPLAPACARSTSMSVADQPHPNPHAGAHLLIPPQQAQALEIAVISIWSRFVWSLALPRVASEVSEFNGLPKGLGKSYPTRIQGVLGTAPKPSGTADAWPVMET